MPPYSNLISDSILIELTIDLLVSLGGTARPEEVVDHVMKISEPEPDLARLLIADLIGRDPRLRFEGDRVELIETDEAGTRFDEASFVVFDLETTGAKAPPCRITEIGACMIKGRQIVDEFNSLINPGVPIPEFITALTGISDDMVRDAPDFSSVAGDFLDFISDSVLVAHNAYFDMSFLNHEIGLVFEGYRVWNPSICTVQMARKLLPQIENHKLNTVASHYAVDLKNHHRAGDDARATAEIFLNLVSELSSRGIDDLGSARRFFRQKHYAKRNEIAA
ncbi:MAG: PolC-type DNA polymerase III [Pyrinomonadaceae bacterium]